MKKVQYLVIPFLFISLISCIENVKKENTKIFSAENLQRNYNSDSLIIKNEEESFNFQWASGYKIIVTGEYGESRLQFNYPAEDFFMINADAVEKELELSLQNNNLDFQIRNVEFQGRSITYEVFYKGESLKKVNLTTSEEITEADFFFSISERFILNNEFIEEEISQSNCPHCISLLSYMLFSNVNEVKAKQKEPWYKQLFN